MCLDSPKARPNSTGLLDGQGEIWDQEFIESLYLYFCHILLPILKFLIHMLEKAEEFGQEDLTEAVGVVVTK